MKPYHAGATGSSGKKATWVNRCPCCVSRYGGVRGGVEGNRAGRKRARQTGKQIIQEQINS